MSDYNSMAFAFTVAGVVGDDQINMQIALETRPEDICDNFNCLDLTFKKSIIILSVDL